MKYEVISAPTTPVVGVAELQQSIPVLSNDHNTTLLALSWAAETYAQQYTRRYFQEHTIIAYFDNWYEAATIHHRPNVEVSTIQYYDSNNAPVVLDESLYTVDNKGLDTRIVYAFACAPQQLGQIGVYVSPNAAPSIGTVANPIRVTYTVGYPVTEYDETNAVPELLRLAIKGLVSHWFFNREPVVTGTIATTIPMHVESILNQYAVPEV